MVRSYLDKVTYREHLEKSVEMWSLTARRARKIPALSSACVEALYFDLSHTDEIQTLQRSALGHHGKTILGIADRSKSCRTCITGSDSISLQFRSEEVYAPEEDTFLLLNSALAEARPEDRVLEVGSGSGFISREMALRVESLLATDINPHAVRATKAKGIEVVRADLFLGIRGKFDLILFNPPYLPTDAAERNDQWINYALDGGESGRETIDRFLKCLPDHLCPGGRSLLLVSSLTGLKEVQEMALAAGLTVKTVANVGCFFEQLYVLRLEVAHKH